MTFDLHKYSGTFLTTLLPRGVALLLASATSVSLLSGVASIADGDRALLAEARQAQHLQLALRGNAQR